MIGCAALGQHIDGRNAHEAKIGKFKNAVVPNTNTSRDFLAELESDKYDDIKPVRWHMIGHLQTNKVKYIIDKVCLIHSVDSVKLMDEIERQAVKHGITMEILIEVNIAGEETKFGVSLDGVDELLAHAGGLSNVQVVGLMTVLPKNATNISRRLHFNDILNKFVDISLNKYDNVNMKYLSMGMSGDYEEAVSCGSNMVRVGSAIFGERYYG